MSLAYEPSFKRNKKRGEKGTPRQPSRVELRPAILRRELLLTLIIIIIMIIIIRRRTIIIIIIIIIIVMIIIMLLRSIMIIALTCVPSAEAALQPLMRCSESLSTQESSSLEECLYTYIYIHTHICMYIYIYMYMYMVFSSLFIYHI